MARRFQLDVAIAMNPPHLSPYVRHGDMVITSGQLALNDQGKVEGDISEQTRLVLNRIATILAEEGMTLTDVRKTTVWLTNAEDFPLFDRTYAEIFGNHRPARSTVIAGLVLPGARIEIEAMATAKGINSLL